MEEIMEFCKEHKIDHTKYLNITNNNNPINDDMLYSIGLLLSTGIVNDEYTSNGDYVFFMGLYQHEHEANFKKAEEYYLRSIELCNNTNAMNNLGHLYNRNLIDIDNSIKYFKMGAKYGDKYAMNNLAMLYRHTLKNYDLAEKYYQMGCENNNIGSYNDYGMFLYDIRKKTSLAINYLTKAAKNGFIKAYNNLGYIYESNGELKMAELYYQRGMDNNCLSAANNMLRFKQYSATQDEIDNIVARINIIVRNH